MSERRRRGHIRLLTHPSKHGEQPLPVRWGAKDARQRGPLIGTLTNPLHRNVIGTHSGSYAIYRALAVAAGSLDVAEDPIWDLTDAIGEGRTGDALAVLSRLLAGGAAPPMLLGTLVGHFRRLLQVADGALPPVPPFVQRKLETQARRYGPRRLVGCMRAIHETDLALKGAGGLRSDLALERLVLGLAG